MLHFVSLLFTYHLIKLFFPFIFFEGLTSNFFACENSCLITAPEGTALSGSMARLVIATAQALGKQEQFNSKIKNYSKGAISAPYVRNIACSELLLCYFLSKGVIDLMQQNISPLKQYDTPSLLFFLPISLKK